MAARKQKRREEKERSEGGTGERKQGRWNNKETSESGKREGNRVKRSGQMGEMGMTKKEEKRTTKGIEAGRGEG